MKRAALVVLAAVSLTMPGCSQSPNTVQVTVEAYISAVSLGESSRILAMLAPYQREAGKTVDPAAGKLLENRFRNEIEKGFIQWEAAKSSGSLEFDPGGIVLIRAIGLGKDGAVAVPLGVTFDDDGMSAIVATRAITNYATINWGGIPTGGRMYLLGMPFGHVINFATGYDDVADLVLLGTVDVEWHLVRLPRKDRPELAVSDWYIDEVRPLAGTEVAWSRKSKAQAR